MSARLFGALLLLSGFTYAGFSFAGRLCRRVRFLRDAKRSVRRMAEEIKTRGLPLSELLVLLSGDGEAGCFFARLALRCNTDPERGAEALWKAVAKEISPLFFLRREDTDALCAAGENLGCLPLSEQADRLFAAESALSRQAELAEEEREKYAGLLRFAGFGAGAVICLLLL